MGIKNYINQLIKYFIKHIYLTFAHTQRLLIKKIFFYKKLLKILLDLANNYSLYIIHILKFY